MTKITNEQLIQNIKNNKDKDKSITELYHRFYNEACKIAYNKIYDKNEAHDIAQNAFIKCIQKIKYYDENKSRFKTWFITIIINCCYNYNQRKKEIYSGVSDTYMIDSNHPDKILQKRESKKLIRNLIKQLKPQYKLLLKARYYDNITYKEISQNLNISITQVKVEIFRAKKQLTKLFKQYDKNRIRSN